MSRSGHLSNRTWCAITCMEDLRCLHGELVILGHLSEHNNHPADRAPDAPAQALERRGLVHAPDRSPSSKMRHREVLAILTVNDPSIYAAGNGPDLERPEQVSSSGWKWSWRPVEALAESRRGARRGRAPAAEHAGFDVARIHEIESEVKHDVIAFTTAVAETMAARGHADASRWLHYGLTSNDVVDTAQAPVAASRRRRFFWRAGSAARGR